MKSVQTKQGGGPDAATLAAFEKMYKDNGGDLKRFPPALELHSKLEPLLKTPPTLPRRWPVV